MQVISLLSEVPNAKLQLFKLREMYEKRFLDLIGVSDLYKMKDVVAIRPVAAWFSCIRTITIRAIRCTIRTSMGIKARRVLRPIC